MKLKTEKLTKIAFFTFLILAVACIVSTVILLIGGIKESIYKVKSHEIIYTSSRLESTPDYGQYYINNIVFLGDGTISPIASSGVIENSNSVWSGESGSLALDFSISTATVVYPQSGESISIATAVKTALPEYIVITLGIDNGVGYCTEEKFTEYYKKLIQTISEASPETKIILQSVFPVSKGYEKKSDSIDNDKIDRANEWIEKIAQETSVRYLDTSSCLKDDKGKLDAKYDSGDGLHLNTNGYVAIIEYIRTHGYK